MRVATIYQKLQVSQYLKLLPHIHLRSLAIEMQFEYNALYLLTWHEKRRQGFDRLRDHTLLHFDLTKSAALLTTDNRQ